MNLLEKLQQIERVDSYQKKIHWFSLIISNSPRCFRKILVQINITYEKYGAHLLLSSAK